MVRLNKIQQYFINMKSANTEIKLGMAELPTGSAMVSEPSGPDVLGNTSESGELSCPHISIDGCKKRTECCGSVTRRVIKMLGDIWRKYIACGLRGEAEK